MIGTVAADSSADALTSPAHTDGEKDGRRCVEFISTKESAKTHWPLAYVTYRNAVADRLGN